MYNIRTIFRSRKTPISQWEKKTSFLREEEPALVFIVCRAKRAMPAEEVGCVSARLKATIALCFLQPPRLPATVQRAGAAALRTPNFAPLGSRHTY